MVKNQGLKSTLVSHFLFYTYRVVPTQPSRLNCVLSRVHKYKCAQITVTVAIKTEGRGCCDYSVTEEPTVNSFLIYANVIR